MFFKISYQFYSLNFCLFLNCFYLFVKTIQFFHRSCNPKLNVVSWVRRRMCIMLDLSSWFNHFFLVQFSRSTLWYPETGLHYPVPGLAYHYILGPERAVHNRERSFHDPEAEAGILQVSKNKLKNNLVKCSVNKWSQAIQILQMVLKFKLQKTWFCCVKRGVSVSIIKREKGWY